MGASGVSALPTFCPFSSSHIQDVMGNFPKKKGGVFLTEHELNAKKQKTKRKKAQLLTTLLGRERLSF